MAQEYITNQLHKKIQAASVDKMKLEKKLEHEQALLTDCITQARLRTAEITDNQPLLNLHHR